MSFGLRNVRSPPCTVCISIGYSYIILSCQLFGHASFHGCKQERTRTYLWSPLFNGIINGVNDLFGGIARCYHTSHCYYGTARAL